MNAIDLLEVQHDEVMRLLIALDASKPGGERNITFRKLKASLLAHMVIEEEVFYPMVVKGSRDGRPVAEGYEEHSAARMALSRCTRVLNQQDLFQVRVRVLKDMIEHHVAEERQTIFPQVRETHESNELETLGLAMAALFEHASRSSTASVDLDLKTTARELHALNTEQTLLPSFITTVGTASS
jgi:iron-sulfur cluster repair protein YtfE (RIC family)